MELDKINCFMVSSTIWQDEGRYSLIHRPATVSVTQGTVTGPGIYSHTITYTIIHFERRLRFCGSFRITEKVAGLLGTWLGKVVKQGSLGCNVGGLSEDEIL